MIPIPLEQPPRPDTGQYQTGHDQWQPGGRLIAEQRDQAQDQDQDGENGQGPVQSQPPAR